MASRKAQRKSKSAYYSSYKRERNRIQRRIKEMQARGYEFTQSILPSIPKKITQKSVNRLAKINLEYLYRHSTYSGLATGETVTGIEGRKLENQVRGYRAANTRVRNKDTSNYDWSNDADWIDKQIDRDEANIEELNQQAFNDMFNASKILEQNTWQILLDRESEFPTQVNEIRLLLMKAETDEPSFWSRLADEHPEFLDELDKALYKGRGSQSIAPRAFNNIRSAILDRPLTLQETKVSMDIYDIDRLREYEPSQDYQDLSSVPFNPNE